MSPASAYDELIRLERMSLASSPVHSLDTRVKILLGFFYLIALVSVAPYGLATLLVLALFPLCVTMLSGLSVSFFLKRTIWVLPFTLCIGIFNPIFDSEALFYMGSVGISGGWVSFTSIILKGVLSAWTALLLITTSGMSNICAALRSMKVPSVLVSQFLFTYRYLFILLEEASFIMNAHALRRGNRASIRINEIGPLAGSLLHRSANRARRIHQALIARGFDGSFKTRQTNASFGIKESTVLIGGVVFIILLRWGNLAEYAGTFLPQI